MEKVACDFCGSGESIPIFSLQDWLTRKPGTFNLVRCTNCGLQYLNPRPNWQELEEYYPDQYHAYHTTGKTGRKGFIEQIKQVGVRRRANAVCSYEQGGKILDVGCATGEFLAEMSRTETWNCYGVEPVKFAAEVARQRSGAEIFEGELLDAHYPDDLFDVVTLWDVLEHTPNPAEMMREIRRIIRPGGLLVIRVPDASCFLSKLFGPYWVAYDAPRHLFSFPQFVIKERLSQEGFEVVGTKYMNSEHSIIFASLSARFLAKGNEFAGKTLHKIAYSSVIRAILSPLFLPVKWLALGSPVYFLRKKANPVV